MSGDTVHRLGCPGQGIPAATQAQRSGSLPIFSHANLECATDDSPRCREEERVRLWEHAPMNCRDAIRVAFEANPRVLKTAEVADLVYAQHPDRPWQRNSVAATLVGLSVNHASSHHYPTERRHAFLFSLGAGRYRMWDPERDGTWEVTPTGVQLVDDSEEAVMAEDITEDDDGATGMSLSLERDLEQCLLTKLDLLEHGLRLYDGAPGGGQQIDTGVVGRLDILAVDQEGRLVVIELKGGRVDDRVCGQILRYMGWVSKNLANGNRVRGIIVANEFTERVRFAAEAMPDVDLVRYEVRFSFSKE
jgi:endonuclease